MDLITPEQFQIVEQEMRASILAAANSSCIGRYCPNADVVLRWRHGQLLPDVDINRKVTEARPMPRG
jgi:hypothetical protein